MPQPMLVLGWDASYRQYSVPEEGRRRIFPSRGAERFPRCYAGNLRES